MKVLLDALTKAEERAEEKRQFELCLSMLVCPQCGKDLKKEIVTTVSINASSLIRFQCVCGFEYQ